MCKYLQRVARMSVWKYQVMSHQTGWSRNCVELVKESSESQWLTQEAAVKLQWSCSSNKLDRRESRRVWWHIAAAATAFFLHSDFKQPRVAPPFTTRVTARPRVRAQLPKSLQSRQGFWSDQGRRWICDSITTQQLSHILNENFRLKVSKTGNKKLFCS